MGDKGTGWGWLLQADNKAQAPNPVGFTPPPPPLPLSPSPHGPRETQILSMCQVQANERLTKEAKPQNVMTPTPKFRFT